MEAYNELNRLAKLSREQKKLGIGTTDIEELADVAAAKFIQAGGRMDILLRIRSEF